MPPAQSIDAQSESGEGSSSLRAYQALERLIVMLELPPGSAATEAALIARTGFGRTPVREAVQRLAWEGLLEIRPRAGILIAPLFPSDWLKVIEARRGLEVVLARAAARNLTDRGVSHLQEAAGAMRHASSLGDIERYLAADKAFDDALAQEAQNPFADRLVAPLRAHSRRFWFRYRSGFSLADAAERHLGVARAVLARDEDGAAKHTKRLLALLRDQAQAAARR